MLGHQRAGRGPLGDEHFPTLGAPWTLGFTHGGKIRTGTGERRILQHLRAQVG